MVATTMPSMSSLLQKLKTEYPHISFISNGHFSWSDQNKTIYFAPKEPDAKCLLLHELAHAQLGHQQYERDIELVKMERDAWDYAVDELANTYNVKVSDSLVQTSLDTYRDWIHARSICPQCSALGYQTGVCIYTCPTCQQTWRVNKAQDCALRRYKTT